jgi:hypothetical protein
LRSRAPLPFGGGLACSNSVPALRLYPNEQRRLAYLTFDAEQIQERYGIEKDQVRRDVDDWYSMQGW